MNLVAILYSAMEERQAVNRTVHYCSKPRDL